MTSSMLWVATRKGLFGIDGSEIRTTAFLGVPVSHVLPTSTGIIAAVGHGHWGVKLHESRDHGKTWTEIAAPKYPPKPEGNDDKCPMRGIPIPWNVELIWTMERAGDTTWIGTIPGGLFKNNELVRPLWDLPQRRKWAGGGYDYPGIHSISIDPRDSNRVMVAISSGGVWLTGDGGATWEPRCKGMFNTYMPKDLAGEPEYQDPHRMVRCPSAPEVLYVQHHNGIFKTEDEGRNWVELKPPPSSFGFATVVHEKNPDIAFFVPAIKDEQRIPVNAELVVTRTRDGGRTFETLREGLPQRHAYDLIYRHGMDLKGEKLAIGSTTGSLWTSDNLGESWRAVSQHLPPIYAVRFGT